MKKLTQCDTYELHDTKKLCQDRRRDNNRTQMFRVLQKEDNRLLGALC